MNCHGNNKNGENKKHNPIKHMLMMVLCCALPFILIAALPFININGGIKAALIGIAPFICPIMMVPMMMMMFKGHKHKDDYHHEEKEVKFQKELE